MKKLFYPLLIILLLAVAAFLGYAYFQNWKKEQIEERGTVLLEKIKEVSKLVTVEGTFSEVYDYKNYWGYDISWFRKKALVRVKATVSVGYDLSNIQVDMDHDQQTIRISGIPQPSILAIDHDLDYYDLSEGTFNQFNEKDYNRINKGAKELIRTRVAQTALYASAEKQLRQLQEVLSFMADDAGWQIEWENPPVSDPPSLNG